MASLLSKAYRRRCYFCRHVGPDEPTAAGAVWLARPLPRLSRHSAYSRGASGRGGADMGMKSMPLSFSPALPCLACRALVTQGLIYQMSSQVWQLLPLCDIHMEEPDEPVPLSTLRCRISEQLAEIQHLHRT